MASLGLTLHLLGCGGATPPPSSPLPTADAAAIVAMDAPGPVREDVLEGDRDATEAGRVDLGPSDRWAGVRAALDRAVAGRRVPGFAFVVRDRGEAPVFSHAGGSLTLTTAIPFDSSVKPITAALLLTLVRDGRLALEDTLSTRLGWQGDVGRVTVEQLMAFSSGFPGSSSCLTPPPLLRNGTILVPMNRASLADCAEQVRAAGLVASPGAEFHYGANHQMILAHLAERLTGETWDQLFEARIARPLGIDVGRLRYRNNRVAASAVGDIVAFSSVYRALALDGGHLSPAAGAALLPRPLAQRFFTDFIQARGTRIDESPWTAINETVHFGLGVWIRCDDYNSRAGCFYLGSGANGTTVVIDPAGQFVAALALYQESFMGYQEGYALMTELLPLLRAAINP